MDDNRQIQYIYDNSSSSAYPPVGYLPANNRDAWAKDYALLSESAQNRTVLHALESSAFVVSLDSESPEGMEAFSRAAWHGGVRGGQMGSRWVDKPVQFIIWDNAKAAIMGEHSGTLPSSLSSVSSFLLEDELTSELNSNGRNPHSPNVRHRNRSTQIAHIQPRPIHSLTLAQPALTNGLGPLPRSPNLHHPCARFHTRPR